MPEMVSDVEITFYAVFGWVNLLKFGERFFQLPEPCQVLEQLDCQRRAKLDR